jgi:hypothetical protein
MENCYRATIVPEAQLNPGNHTVQSLSNGTNDGMLHFNAIDIVVSYTKSKAQNHHGKQLKSRISNPKQQAKCTTQQFPKTQPAPYSVVQ